MKVTVCFDNLRVIVPCGDGSLLVRDLIDKATIRYKKATAKPSSCWVHVHFLKVSRDGGILDPDDQLIDVADDREQIVADFEEQGRNSVPHNGGDGTSASSTGTASPDLYHNRDFTSAFSSTGKSSEKYEVEYKRPDRNHVIITRSDLTTASPLRVRRGSEPCLANIGTSSSSSTGRDVTEDHQPISALSSSQPISALSSSLPRKKHWRTLTVVTDASDTNGNRAARRSKPKRKKRRRSLPQQDVVYSDEDDDHNNNSGNHGRRVHSDDNLLQHHHGNGENSLHLNHGNFTRDSARKSLGTGNISSMYKWLDAQEQTELRLQQGLDRKEPLGGTGSITCNHSDTSRDTVTSSDTVPRDSRLLISLTNQAGPLGIHVVPNYDLDGNNTSLLIQGIEPGGRIMRDGRLHVGDSILDINGTSLIHVDFNSAQEVFKDALMTDSIDLIIDRPDQSIHTETETENENEQFHNESENESKVRRQSDSSRVPPPVLPKPNHRLRVPELDHSALVSPVKRSSEEVSHLDVSGRNARENSPQCKDEIPMMERGQFNSSTNTKRIGNKMTIKLVKGEDGLGFSITTRDNPAGGSCPIYIKNILPKGAAIKNGQLKPGDRLLKVKGVDLTDKAQTDAVALLRSANLGDEVELLVSRQPDQFQVPRPMKTKSTSPETTEDEAPSSRNREVLSLDIPLNETGSAGLGVSVKGKTITQGDVSTDLGIFVRSVIHGGAARKDGRLRVNDQLIEVNGLPLTGQSNPESMLTLRLAMVADGPKPGYINLVVSRKMGAPTPTPDGGTFSFQSLGYDNREYCDSSVKSGSQLSLNDLSRTNDSSAYGIPSANDSFGFENQSTNESSGYIIILANENNSFSQRDPDEDGLTNHRAGKLSVYTPTKESSNQGNSLPRMNKGNNRQIKPRPHSTMGFLRVESDEEEEGARVPRDGTDGPQKGENGETIPFSREAPGRRSMSEKRKGHLDPKNMEFYKQMKNDKQQSPREPPDPSDEIPAPGPLKRIGSAESLIRSNLSINDPTYHRPVDQLELGPMLGLKKSSSLESLQAAVRDLETQVLSDDDEGGFWPHNRRITNDSFRAAVDRSYENQTTADTMDMLEEEESWRVAPSIPASSTSSFNAGVTSGRGSAVDKAFTSHSNLNSKSSTSTKEPSKSVKDKKKIFKGLFKFGQKRKSIDNSRLMSTQQSRIQQEEELQKAREEFEAYRAKKTAEIEQKRIREQYEKLKQQQEENKVQPPQTLRYSNPSNRSRRNHGDGGFSSPSDGEEISRSDKITQLRLEHQRRHQERLGKYPLDDQEEWAEKEIQRLELQNIPRPGNPNGQDSVPDWLETVPDPMYAQIRPLKERPSLDRPSSTTLYNDSVTLKKSSTPGYHGDEDNTTAAGNHSNRRHRDTTSTYSNRNENKKSSAILVSSNNSVVNASSSSNHSNHSGYHGNNNNNNNLSPRGPYVSVQPQSRRFNDTQQLRTRRSGSFEIQHSRSRSESRDPREASVQSAGDLYSKHNRVNERVDPRIQTSQSSREREHRYRSKTPVFTSSGYHQHPSTSGSGSGAYERNRLSLAMPPNENLYVNSTNLDLMDDPRKAYQPSEHSRYKTTNMLHQQQAQHRKNGSGSKITSSVS